MDTGKTRCHVSGVLVAVAVSETLQRLLKLPACSLYRQCTGDHRAMAPKYDGLSHCKLALVFALVMDLLGVISLLLGVFAQLEIQGRDFGDLLVYSGALLVLLSLAGWVMWYSGNIEGLTSKRELGATGGVMDRFARSLSRRIRIPTTRSSPT